MISEIHSMMNRPFIIKATKTDPPIECTWHLDAETKEDAEAAFKLLMPSYTVVKVKSKKPEPETEQTK
jgi:hypothetical protein